MSRVIGCNVSASMPRTHVVDADKRLKEDADNLCATGVLRTRLRIPDAASDLYIEADLSVRSLRVAMTLDAPKDRKSTKARLNWLLKQIKEVDPDGVYVGLVWSSRRANSVYPLEELREKLDEIAAAPRNVEIRSLEISLTARNAKRFVGRRTFIEEVEFLVPRFYEMVGQNLRSWKPSPPKTKHPVGEKVAETVAPIAIDGEISEKGNDNQIKSAEKPAEENANPGNDHANLLDIPKFLKRLSVFDQ